jgi:hypothetical protein
MANDVFISQAPTIFGRSRCGRGAPTAPADKRPMSHPRVRPRRIRWRRRHIRHGGFEVRLMGILRHRDVNPTGGPRADVP